MLTAFVLCNPFIGKSLYHERLFIRKFLHLFFPLLFQRCRANYQCFFKPENPLFQNGSGNGLDGFPQPHFIGNDGIFTEQCKLDAFFLVGIQIGMYHAEIGDVPVAQAHQHLLLKSCFHFFGHLGPDADVRKIGGFLYKLEKPGNLCILNTFGIFKIPRNQQLLINRERVWIMPGNFIIVERVAKYFHKRVRFA